jgi:hypothetical protein
MMGALGQWCFNCPLQDLTIRINAKQKEKSHVIKGSMALTSGTHVSVTLPNEVRAATEKQRRKMSVFW